MLRHLPAAVGVVLIVAAGVLNGQKTDRWGMAAKVQAAADRLDNVPAVFGDWSSTEVKMPAGQLQQAEAVGHLSRRYVNRKTNEAVSVLIVCGRHGPISVHPPTVCFTGAGWQLTDPEEPYELKRRNQATHRFWKGDFVKTVDGIPQRQRTFWGWSTNGTWRAEDNPRLAFAGSSYLYKMYVTRMVPERAGQPEEGSDDDGPAVSFLREFIPILREAVFQSGSPAASNTKQ